MSTIRWVLSAPPAAPDVQSLASEHGALARQMAALQHRVSEQLVGYAVQVQTLEAEVVCLRGRLVLVRTACLWGLPSVGLSAAIKTGRAGAELHSRAHAVALAAQGAQSAHLPEASAVICQTGCTGHAHPWLDADGLCRRTGNACDSQPAMAKASKV